ncbi:MAG: hypothetical protein ACTSUM_04115, partial [Alphaproteobacteria bacterium]
RRLAMYLELTIPELDEKVQAEVKKVRKDSNVYRALELFTLMFINKKASISITECNMHYVEICSK